MVKTQRTPEIDASATSPRDLLVALLFLALAGLLPAQEKEQAAAASQEEIDRAIDRGVRWLVRTQEVDGGWKGPHPDSFPAGMTGLAVYTLLKTGMPADHRVIRKGLAFMESKPCEKTYAVGTNLLAYSAVPAELRPKRRIRELTTLLVDTLGDFGWRYNRPQNNVFDLSNGQYAVLGLRAAVAMGEDVPTDTWRRAARIFMRLQGHYGGWGYGPNDEWADAGMTAAGIFCLAACREQLIERRTERGLCHEIAGRIDLGRDWYEKNWSVTENIIRPDDVGKRQRWIFHYLYGLERVGALTGEDLIGGHDWYDDGAAWLLKKQDTNGSWASAYGERDVNSCLALLFLARGSRSTAVAPRKPMAVEAAAAETFIIRSNGENPTLAWITRFEKKVRARLDAGERIAALAWDLNGEEIHRIAVEGAFDLRAEGHFLKHRFERNGDHVIQARLAFVKADGSPSGEEISTAADLRIDDIEEPADREAIADIGRNRLDGIEISARASSELNNGWAASAAADGHHSTSWVCADDDVKPTLELILLKGVHAGTLKLVGANNYGAEDDDWARPRDVEIIINGRKRIEVTLPDDCRSKHSVDIGKLRVRRIRVQIKSLYPGKKQATRVGLKEIELHP